MSMKMKLKQSPCYLVFALLVTGMLAQPVMARDKERPFVDDIRPMSDMNPDDVVVQEWAEQATQLPPYPQQGNLLEFNVDRPGSRFRYYIDQTALSVGEDDNVIRYTLVIESDRGSRNIYYEGMRCDQREYKSYAYGGRNNTFTPIKTPDWKEINGTGVYKFRYDLMDYYMCETGLARSPDKIVANIKSGSANRSHQVDMY